MCPDLLVRPSELQLVSSHNSSTTTHVINLTPSPEVTPVTLESNHHHIQRHQYHHHHLSPIVCSFPQINAFVANNTSNQSKNNSTSSSLNVVAVTTNNCLVSNSDSQSIAATKTLVSNNSYDPTNPVFCSIKNESSSSECFTPTIELKPNKDGIITIGAIPCLGFITETLTRAHSIPITCVSQVSSGQSCSTSLANSILTSPSVTNKKVEFENDPIFQESSLDAQFLDTKEASVEEIKWEFLPLGHSSSSSAMSESQSSSSLAEGNSFSSSDSVLRPASPAGVPIMPLNKGSSKSSSGRSCARFGPLLLTPIKESASATIDLPIIRKIGTVREPLKRHSSEYDEAYIKAPITDEVVSLPSLLALENGTESSSLEGSLLDLDSLGSQAESLSIEQLDCKNLQSARSSGRHCVVNKKYTNKYVSLSSNMSNTSFISGNDKLDPTQLAERSKSTRITSKATLTKTSTERSQYLANFGDSARNVITTESSVVAVSQGSFITLHDNSTKTSLGNDYNDLNDNISALKTESVISNFKRVSKVKHTHKRGSQPVESVSKCRNSPNTPVYHSSYTNASIERFMNKPDSQYFVINPTLTYYDSQHSYPHLANTCISTATINTPSLAINHSNSVIKSVSSLLPNPCHTKPTQTGNIASAGTALSITTSATFTSTSQVSAASQLGSLATSEQSFLTEADVNNASISGNKCSKFHATTLSARNSPTVAMSSGTPAFWTNFSQERCIPALSTEPQKEYKCDSAKLRTSSISTANVIVPTSTTSIKATSVINVVDDDPPRVTYHQLPCVESASPSSNVLPAAPDMELGKSALALPTLQLTAYARFRHCDASNYCFKLTFSWSTYCEFPFSLI